MKKIPGSNPLSGVIQKGQNSCRNISVCLKMVKSGFESHNWPKPNTKLSSGIFHSWVNVMGKNPHRCSLHWKAGYCFKPLPTLKSINDMDKALRILIKLLAGFYRCTLLFLPGSNQREEDARPPALELLHVLSLNQLHTGFLACVRRFERSLTWPVLR